MTRGPVRHTANVLRTAAVASGGFIAAARNPLPAAHVREHGAVGAISFAMRLGEAILVAAPNGPEGVIEAITSKLGGRILGRGQVRDKRLRTEGGFDVGVSKPASSSWASSTST